MSYRLDDRYGRVDRTAAFAKHSLPHTREATGEPFIDDNPRPRR